MASIEVLKKIDNILRRFRDRYGVVFNDKRHLLEALDHTASNSEKKKKYALAGDALLDFILYDYLLEKGTYSKGKMDCIRQKLNTDDNLACIGKKIGLNEFIIFPESASEDEKVLSKTYYNDTLEALIYLIMKDQDLESTKQFVKKNILSEIPKNEYGC